MRTDTPLRRLIPLGLAGGALYLAALIATKLPCWGLFLPVLPVAWPIWAYWSDSALFARRIWLQAVTRPGSRVRRWFIRGRLLQGVIAVIAILLTAVLLAIASRFGLAHWLALALDILLLSLLAGPVERRLATEVQGDKAAFVARRWPLLWINLLLLAGLFFVIDYAVLGGPDSRGQTWTSVAERAFADAAADAACPAAGWAAGVPAALRALTWHASLLLIPALPQPLLRLGAWLLSLFGAGLFGWLFTAMLLGTLALVEQGGARRWPPAGRAAGGLASTAFIYTILALALPYLYAVQALRQFDPGVLAQPAQRLLTWTDPCRWDPSLATFTEALPPRLQATRIEAMARADERIHAALDEFFTRAALGVDRYLDWYFSVVGEYQRLGIAAVGDFGALMTERIQRHLVTETGYAAWLEHAYATLDADTADRLGALADALGVQLQRAGEASDCALQRLPRPDLGDGVGRDLRRVSTAAATGAAIAAVSAKLMANQVAGAIAAKVAGKQSVKTAIALLSKAAAKKGGSALAAGVGGTVVCAPGGLLAAGCGVVAGIATWLTVDKALVEIDELRFRQAMRDDLLAVLEEQRAMLVAALHERQAAAVDAGLAALAGRLGQRYVPASQ